MCPPEDPASCCRPEPCQLLFPALDLHLWCSTQNGDALLIGDKSGLHKHYNAASSAEPHLGTRMLTRQRTGAEAFFSNCSPLSSADHLPDMRSCLRRDFSASERLGSIMIFMMRLRSSICALSAEEGSLSDSFPPASACGRSSADAIVALMKVACFYFICLTALLCIGTPACKQPNGLQVFEYFEPSTNPCFKQC